MKRTWIVRSALAAVVLAAPLALAMDGAATAQQVRTQKGPGGGPGAGSGPGAGAGSGGGAPAAKVDKPQAGPTGRSTRSAPPAANGRPMVVKKKSPLVEKRKTPLAGEQAPPVVAKKHKGNKKDKHAHKRWRPGLKWRWLVVPSIIIAEELDWCHYHRYRVRGMHFHTSVRCHRHDRWDHPALRYVEAY